MSRHFTAASSEKIVLAIGGLGFAFGPGTMAAIVRLDSYTSDGRIIFHMGVDAVNRATFYVMITTGILNLNVAAAGSSTESYGVTGLSLNTWYFVAVSKATGTVTPRFHIYNFATNTWIHENGTQTCINSGVPVTSNFIGQTPTPGKFYDGDIAVEAVWDIVLTDAQIESLPFNLQAWYAPVAPRGMWILDQQAVGQKVRDITGAHADESSITGTAVSTNSVPIWLPGSVAVYVT